MALTPRLSNTEKAATTATDSTASTATTSAMPVTTTASADNGSTTRYQSNNDILSALGFNPLPNSLDGYDNVTYHFKLAMLSDNYDTLSSAKQVVIAESGATILNILSVHAEQSLMPNFRTKNINWQTFTMELFEPMGANFYDKILDAATELYVQNIQKCFYNLNLTFIGYDPTTGVPEVIGGQSWNWPLTITDITTDLSEKGAIHKVNFIVAYAVPATDSYNLVDQSYQISGNTLADVLSSLATKLNQQSKDMYTFPMKTYIFKYLPYTNADTTVSNPGDHVVNLSAETDVIVRNPEGASVAGGTTIDALINSLLSNSETAAKLASPGRTVDNSPVSNENRQPSSYLVSITTNVKLGTYHPAFGEYERVITYTIGPYETTRVYGNVSQSSDITDKGANQRKLQYMISKNFLRKDYEYIFTGENSEILDFNISSNFSYVALQTYMAGQYHNASEATPQVSNQTEVNSARSSYQKQLAEASTANQVLQLKAMASADAASAQATIDKANSTLQTNASDSSAQAARAEATAKLEEANQNWSTAAAKLATFSQDELQSDYTARDTIKARLASNPNTMYVDDYNNSSTTPDFTTLCPITMKFDASETTNTTHHNIDGHWDNRRSMFNFILEQMYEPMGASMMDINLTVRGDPYWLGASYMGNNYNSDDMRTQMQSFNDIPVSNTWANDISFVLRFVTPTGYNDDGSPILSRNNYFTGFYSCVEVAHTWADGAYTQKLHGLKIQSMEFQKLIGGS